jgi:hypothetical protein
MGVVELWDIYGKEEKGNLCRNGLDTIAIFTEKGRVEEIIQAIYVAWDRESLGTLSRNKREEFVRERRIH